MAIQDDNTILNKGDLKAYHEAIAPMLGGTLLSRTNVSDHYSTDEKIVGVWTDGKPLYQKIVDFGAIPSGRLSGGYVMSSGLTNVERFFVKRLYTTSGAPLPYFRIQIGESDGVSIATLMYLDNGTPTLNISTDTDRSGFGHIFGILQYTKTTDTAGSGVTTPGAYDINFPNTWKENTEIYFGNGVYGQRFTGTITAAAATRAIVILDANIINAKLVSQGGYWTDTNDGNYPIGSYNADTNQFYKMACITGGGSNDGIFLNQYSNVARSNSPYDVWVTYTK